MSHDKPAKRGPGRPRKNTIPADTHEESVEEVEPEVEAEIPDVLEGDVVEDETPLPPAVAEVVAPLPPSAGRPCALDDAPIGSKIVVSKDTDSVKRVNLTMPNGTILLPSDDVAYTLTVGAKIRRVMPSVFEATELNPPVDYPKLVTSTARDAVARYREHFHKD